MYFEDLIDQIRKNFGINASTKPEQHLLLDNQSYLVVCKEGIFQLNTEDAEATRLVRPDELQKFASTGILSVGAPWRIAGSLYNIYGEDQLCQLCAEL